MKKLHFICRNRCKKNSTVACVFSPIKIHNSDNPKRINEVSVCFCWHGFCDLSFTLSKYTLDAHQRSDSTELAEAAPIEPSLFTHSLEIDKDSDQKSDVYTCWTDAYRPQYINIAHKEHLKLIAPSYPYPNFHIYTDCKTQNCTVWTYKK